MSENKYSIFFPNINDKRKQLFKNFYKIKFREDLPITNKNRKNIGFHPLISSYVLRHILWEILNCPRGSFFKKVINYNINEEIYEKTKNVFNSVYIEGIKGKYIFEYDNDFITGNKESPYSGLTNAKMLYIYSYYNSIKKSEKYTIFCNNILNSLLLNMKNGGCCILLSENKLWIDEEANYPNFILNGFLSIIRNLIDLINCIKNSRIENILFQNKNIIEFLLPLFDNEKYKTSKYRLTSYGQIKLKIKSNNNTKLNANNIKLKIIYDDEYNYPFKYLNKNYDTETFKNIFKIKNNEIHIHFIYSEIFKTKIEISFIDENFYIIDSYISNYDYIKKCTRYKKIINFKNINLNHEKYNKKIIINLNKNIIDYFTPSITYFTKEYNNHLYNVYHYNHIINLKYINKYFKSEIIKMYVNKWEKYTTEWKDHKLYNQIENISFSRIS